MTGSSRRSPPCLCPIVRLLNLRLHLPAPSHLLPAPLHPLPPPMPPLPAPIPPLPAPIHLLPAPIHPRSAPRLHHVATPPQQAATPQAVTLSQLGTELQVAAKLPPLTACLSAPRSSSVSDYAVNAHQWSVLSCRSVLLSTTADVSAPAIVLGAEEGWASQLQQDTAPVAPPSDQPHP